MCFLAYDSNGNLLTLTNAASSVGMTMAYDEAERLTSVTMSTGGTEYYGYDPSNRRIYMRDRSGNEKWTMYGAEGEKGNPRILPISIPSSFPLAPGLHPEAFQ